MSESTRMQAPAVSEAPEEIAYELRSAEGATWTAGKLLVGIGAFFYVGLGFAYFYLRSANDLNLWRPHDVTAPQNLGAVIFGVTVAAGLLNYYGTIRLRRGMTVDWEVAGWGAVGGLLLALALQIWEMTRLGFAPASSGYSSLFIAWGGMNIATLVLSAYWLETVLARSMRLRHTLGGEEGGPARSTAAGARLWRANLEAVTYFLGFVGLVELLFWIFFYLI